jgi:hypothetical protein
MTDAPIDYIATAENDGAVFMRAVDGTWFAHDNKDGATIIRDAISLGECARLYCESQELVPLDNEQILARIKRSHRPACDLPEFEEGYLAYTLDGVHRRNPYDSGGYKASAFDRGANAAMLYRRALAHLDKHKDDVEKPGPGWLSRILKTGRVG